MNLKWADDPATRPLLLVNLAAIMEKADESLLPAVYSEVSKAFRIEPAALGALTLVRALSQAASFPLAAYLALRYDRVRIIALGALIWGVATSAVGFASTYGLVVAARVINGVGLALVIPAIQSLVADSTSPESRGVAFGWLQLLSNIGSILGGTMGILLAPLNFPLGIAGWRMAFHLVAVVSYAVALLLYGYGVDPKVTSSEGSGPAMGWLESTTELMQGCREVLRVKTFQIIVAQGIVGSIPWAALAFGTMWLQLIGFGHFHTALLLACFVVSSAFGALFGGWLGDFMARIFPNHGRIVCSQISAGCAIPMATILLRLLPHETRWGLLYGVLFGFMGFLISWNAPATNNPIFAEIVSAKWRTSIYALDRSFEMALAAFAPPFVGFLTEMYGYKSSDSGSGAGVGSDKLQRRKNTEALSKGLYATIVPPIVLCCAIYTLLYWTYPRDRDSAAEAEKRTSSVQMMMLQPDGGDGMAAEEEEAVKQEVKREEERLLGESR